MIPHKQHRERHAVSRVGWLRAAVLGANDGILSTASLLVGVASAGTDRTGVLLAGVAGLVAGAMSMAAGEYVSVSSQSDTERADLARERKELAETPQLEREELANIYIGRGLTSELAHQVADQMTAHDALGAHARDELGITEIATARPIQAAVTSAVTFSVGAVLPLIAAILVPTGQIAVGVSIASVACLILLGVLGAQAGKAKILDSVVRVTFWGIAAMAVTALVGKLFGAAV
jgi:VIT1/CCC1 family predicted Fe2+/Mn2+ transporter